MFKVDRVDKVDSLWTCFIIYTDNGESQEFNVPVWDANDFEAKVNSFTDIDFNNFKDKDGKKNARSGQ